MGARPATSDHKQKKPLEQRVRVFLDDEPIEALEDAREELSDAEAHAEKRYQTRLALARQANTTPTELMTIEKSLDDERIAAVKDKRDAVEAAEKAVLEASQLYVFRSPRIQHDGQELRGNRAFQQLISDHPPEDEDHDDARLITGRPEALARWHTATFAPALIAACCTEPKLTIKQATEIYEDWTDAESGELFTAALSVCEGSRQVALGKSSRAASKRG